MVKGADNHITKGGAKKVIISAPAQGEDLTVVLGVNEDLVRPRQPPRGFQRFLHDELVWLRLSRLFTTTSRSSAPS
jgi:hypothetical protein